MKTKKQYLIPLSYLLQVEKIENINLNKDGAEHIKDYYNLEIRKEIYLALFEFENIDIQNYDFQALLKDSGLLGPIKFSNLQIYNYLMDFKAFMEDEKFGLLIDNRPPKEL